MKYCFQACIFQPRKGDKSKLGIARVISGYNSNDVAYITDMDGKKQECVWNYRLLEGPLSYIEIEDRELGKGI